MTSVESEGDEHKGDDEANAHASRGHVYFQQVGARADLRDVSLSRDAVNFLGSSNFRARFSHCFEFESELNSRKLEMLQTVGTN